MKFEYQLIRASYSPIPFIGTTGIGRPRFAVPKSWCCFPPRIRPPGSCLTNCDPDARTKSWPGRQGISASLLGQLHNHANSVYPARPLLTFNPFLGVIHA